MIDLDANTICPHCGGILRLPSCAQRNMESYGKSCLVATECCGGAVRANPVVAFRVTACNDKLLPRVDDWGTPFRRRVVESMPDYEQTG